METITADILVVGGGVGGTAAAVQAARRNASLNVVLVSALPWLGGMLTSAGVSAPDGNELAAFQTGIWGDFLKALGQRHPKGLGNGWVSFFTYNPAVGAQIFADWVAALPNLQWIVKERPRAVLKHTERIIGVQFDALTVQAKITIDGTELGDVLALADVPYRWGWETQDVWQEPSAPRSLSDPSDPLYDITQRYPVQSPTWVVIMQDYGSPVAPAIAPSFSPPDSAFEGAWANYGDADTTAGEACLNYGRLPDNQFMINWPHKGNDYGINLNRLVESEAARAAYGQEAQRHSQAFARYIQTQLGRRYGLAQDVFPATKLSPGGGFALMPYYRESRRVKGLTTVCERDILPMDGAQVAALPLNEWGKVSAIAYGNYPNDHHYPGFEMPLAPKAIRWGGRWTGTPFTIPYEALVPEATEGLLVCEKNISVSHIANGATRLQPVVLGIGQAAGMAAALCVEKGYEPRDLVRDVRSLQSALLTDPTAPAAVIPLFNLPPDHPQWRAVQQSYLARSKAYPASGHHTFERDIAAQFLQPLSTDLPISLTGRFHSDAKGHYELHQTTDKTLPNCILLLTVRSEITELFIKMPKEQEVHVLGIWNSAGKWLLCERINTL